MAFAITRTMNSVDRPSLVWQEQPMVMARHDNEREKFVPLVCKVKERILNDLSLAGVGKMRYWAVSIKQLIDLREQQFVFLVFPFVIRHVRGFWSCLKLLSQLAYLR